MILIMGGYDKGIWDDDKPELSSGSTKTWIVDSTNGTFIATKGPPLLRKHRDFSCGKMVDDHGNILIIVAGSSHSTERRTVEILNMTTRNWTIGLLRYF